MNEVSPYFIQRIQEAVHPPNGQPNGSPNGWNSEPNLKEYWNVVRKHGWTLASASGAAAILALIWFITRTPLYLASATIMIQPQAPQVLDMQALLAEQTQDLEHDYYKTQYDILTTRSLAARVIHGLDLEHNSLFVNNSKGGLIGTLRALIHPARPKGPGVTEAYEVAPATVDSYLSRLSIQPLKGTRLVAVAFVTPDPVLSARIANAHVEAYIHQEMEIHSQTGHDAEDFLQQKLTEIREKVEKSEAALNDYRRKRGIVTDLNQDPMKPEQGQPLLQRLNELNTELSRASGDKIKLETLHQLVAHGRYESLPEVLNSPVIQELKEESAKLSAEYASLSNRFNPGYHPLDDLKARLDDAQHKSNSEMLGVAQGVETEYQAAVAYETKLNTEIDEVRSQAMALDDASLQYAILGREVSANQELYKQVLERMNQLRVSSDVPTTNISLIDPAHPPLFPTGPRLLMVLIFALSFGLFAGVGVVMFLESLDDGFKNGDELRRYLALPSLGVIPDLKKVNGQSTYGYSSYRRAINGNGNTKKSHDEVPSSALSELVVTHGRLSTAGEFYRIIRNGIMYSKAGGAPRSVVITSAHPGEGKTVTAINLASTFAQLGGKTLLVDTDLRRPRCHELLKLKLHQGLTEVLVGRRDLDEVIQSSAVTGLYLLSAGALPPNPSELLISDEMKHLVERMLTEYEYVCFDAAPVMPISDPVGLSRLVEGVVVVAGRQTPKRIVWEACHRISAAGGKILGVVLNRADAYAFPYANYGQYYGSYDPTREAANSENATSV
jgi:capsular exopolysaccharide synthesis family protein